MCETTKMEGWKRISKGAKFILERGRHGLIHMSIIAFNNKYQIIFDAKQKRGHESSNTKFYMSEKQYHISTENRFRYFERIETSKNGWIYVKDFDIFPLVQNYLEKCGNRVQ